LVGGRVGEEGAHLGGRRQLAGHVERGATQEGGVVGQGRRRQVEAPELVEDVAGGGGGRRHRGGDGAGAGPPRPGPRGGGAGGGRLGAAGANHRSVAGTVRVDAAVRAGRRPLTVQRLERTQGRHVRRRAVGEGRRDGQAVALARLDHLFGRRHAQGNDARR